MSKKHITARLDPEIVEALDQMPGDTRADKIAYAVMSAAVGDLLREEIRSLGRAQTRHVERLSEEIRDPKTSNFSIGVDPEMRWVMAYIAQALSLIIPEQHQNTFREQFVNVLKSGKPLTRIEETEGAA